MTTANITIGTGATLHGFSDCHAYEVISKTPCTLTVRTMSATLSPEWKPAFTPGGFGAHCTNQASQQWILASDTEGAVDTIRLCKSGHWQGKHGRYSVGIAREFHDYNF